MREGKKVTRPHWEEQSYWKFSTDKFQRICYSDDTPAKVHLRQLEATDWKIWEKDLSMTHRKAKELIWVLEHCKIKKVDTNALIKFLKE